MGFWLWSRLASSAWGLREAKSSSGLKDHYLDDLPRKPMCSGPQAAEFM